MYYDNTGRELIIAPDKVGGWWIRWGHLEYEYENTGVDSRDAAIQIAKNVLRPIGGEIWIQEKRDGDITLIEVVGTND